MSNQQGNWVRYDPSFDTERNTRNAAAAATESSERLIAVVNAMEVQVELARASQANAERSERFTRRMGWISVSIAGASLAAAIAAVVVTLALNAG